MLKENLRGSLVVQWLELGAFTAVDKVQSLVGKLRSYTSYGIYQIKKKKKEYLALAKHFNYYLLA